MTISDLRDSPKVKACIDAGETIDLRESERVVAQIILKTESDDVKQAVPAAFKMPDFEARHQKLFGDRVLNANDFLEDRHGRY